ncbi:DMT family transporter [Bacillus horti]
MVLAATVLWGLSGTAAQFLFQQTVIQVDDLVFIRLFVSGILLLLLARWREGSGSIWRVWRDRFSNYRLIIFGLLGMLAVQYTFFVAIAEGDAATATLLQFLGPLFITIYVALRALRWPTGYELLAVGIALCGVALLVTNGRFTELAVSKETVLWGLASALALAFYTLYPIPLLRKWSSTMVVGWGMMIGAVGLAIVRPPWQIFNIDWNMTLLGFVFFVVIFGTLVPFYMYMESLRYIQPSETSILSSAEPLAAAISAVVWLNVSFGFFQAIGGVCIMLTVIIISKAKRKIAQDQKIGGSL